MRKADLEIRETDKGALMLRENAFGFHRPVSNRKVDYLTA
jgi:hypothetical protein